MCAPTTSGSTTFGPGTANNLLRSNGTSVYWSALAASDIPTISITEKTSGTLTVARGGTGQTSIANIQAGKDGDGNTISSTYLKLNGGTLTNVLNFKGNFISPQINFGCDAFTYGSRNYYASDYWGSIHYDYPYKDSSTFTAGHYIFSQQSYDATSGAALDYRELYDLPPVTAGLTSSKFYPIYTGKNTTSIYTVISDTLIKSNSTGTTKGGGQATVIVIGNAVIINFAAKITTAGTVSNVYDVGISVNTLRSINSNIPNFIPCHSNSAASGNITYYDSDGKYSSKNGYAGVGNIMPQGSGVTPDRWHFARIYQFSSPQIGPWADNTFTVGMVITGTLYGKIPY